MSKKLRTENAPSTGPERPSLASEHSAEGEQSNEFRRGQLDAVPEGPSSILDVAEKSIEQDEDIEGLGQDGDRLAAASDDGGTGGGNGLPDGLKAGIEGLSGLSMDDVKVNYNSSSPSDVQALAFAEGNEIHLGPGQEEYLGHEAWHVVQQKQGRVAPTVQKKGVGSVNDDASLEREADVMGARAAGFSGAAPANTVEANASGGVKQLASDYDGLLPAHDTYDDEYEIGNNNDTSSDFTYHHIIPENKLKEVKTELDGIADHFKDLAATDDNAGLRQANTTLEGAKTDLVDGAKTSWLATRVKNTTHAINTTLDTYGVVVTETEVGALLTQDGDLATTFSALKPLIKRKAQPLFNERYTRRISGVTAVATDGLKDDNVYGRLSVGDEGEITGLLQSLDTNCYLPPAAVAGIRAALIELPKDPRFGKKSKAKIRDVFRDQLRFWTFDKYFAEMCGPLHEDSTGSDTHLKKIVQRHGIADDDDELESAVAWNPGNIHRGPSSSKRLNPDSPGFNAWLDDGGDGFETAAVNVLAPDRFAAVQELNAQIDTFLSTRVAAVAPDQAKVERAVDVVERMAAVRAFGVKEFDASQWEPHGDNMMRLRRREPNGG